MKAYVLVKFEADVDMTKVNHALTREEITTIDLVIGTYDAIVMLEVADMATLGKLLPQIRSCPGIQDSVTLPVIAGS